MKQMQRLLSLLLAAALLLTAAVQTFAADTEDFDYVPVDGGVLITAYSGSETDLAIPAALNGLPVVGLDADFIENSHLEDTLRRITLPDTITALTDEQFAHCGALEEVVFGSGMQSFGKSVFFDCTALQTFTIPDSVTYLASGTFKDCYGLKTVTVGSGVSVLPPDMFDMCLALQTVYTGENVTAVEPTAFAGCFSRGGDLFLYSKLVSLPAAALDEDFSGTFHCYPDTPAYTLLMNAGYDVVAYAPQRLRAETDVPLTVTASAATQAVPTSGLHVFADFADPENPQAAIPAIDVTAACTVPQTMIFASAGSVQVPVSYNGLTASFTVTVLSAAVTPVRLEILSQPTAVYYVSDAAQTIDINGLRVQAVYSDGSRRDVTSECAVDNRTRVFSAAGTETVTVHFGALSTSFTVTVRELQLQIKADGSAVSGVYKKKIALFSSYRKNPVALTCAGIGEDEVQSVQWRVTEGTFKAGGDGVVTHTGFFAATGVVHLTVTDVHGGTHTAQVRIIFYRFALQMLLQFSKYR